MTIKRKSKKIKNKNHACKTKFKYKNVSDSVKMSQQRTPQYGEATNETLETWIWTTATWVLQYTKRFKAKKVQKPPEIKDSDLLSQNSSKRQLKIFK